MERSAPSGDLRVKASSTAFVQVLWPFLFLCAFTLFVFLCIVYKSVCLDDAYITARYAANLAHGFGIGWNQGEKPVEGCTEFLWMMGTAVAIRLGFAPLAASQIASFVLTVATVTIPFTSLNRVSTTLRSRFLAASLLSMAPVVAFYAVSGMGHPLFNLLFTMAALLLHQSLRFETSKLFASAGFFFGLATLARPEGFEFFLIAAMVVTIACVGGRTSLRNLLLFAGAFLTLDLPYTVWRLSHYGYFFPNTFYAKHTGGLLLNLPSGLFYLSRELSLYAGAALLCCVFAFLVGYRKPGTLSHLKEELPAISLVLLVLATLAYTTVLGGDDIAAFPSVRLLTPALPILYILCAEALERLTLSRGLNFSVAGIAFMAVLLLSQTLDNFDLIKFSHSAVVGTDDPGSVVQGSFGLPPRQNYEVTPLVRWINVNLRDGCVVAIPWAGRAGYGNKCTLIDEDGLNDLHIAHLPKRQRGTDVKGDADYVLGRHPDLVFVNVDPLFTRSHNFAASGGWKLTDKELADKLVASPAYKQIEIPAYKGLVFRRTN